MKALYGNQLGTSLAEVTFVNVDQFYGIELEEFPAQISMVAMWLIDHQMNMEASKEFGEYYRRLALTKSATIINDNALRLDWDTVVPKKDDDLFIMGNPPFIGTSYQNEAQKMDVANISEGAPSIGMLDYVTCWYVKTAKFIQDTNIRAAFVSTSSISQGEQVGVLWNVLFHKFKIKIQFAHRTFRWNNEAKGVAAVHVVIIGISTFDSPQKRLFDYVDVNSEPQEVLVKSINPYLVEGSEIVLSSIARPISEAPLMQSGSTFRDGGFLIFTDAEKDEIVAKEPAAKKYIRQFMSTEEFLYNTKRWCFRLKDADPSEIKNIKVISERLKQVREFREKSTRAGTKKMADYPMLLAEERQPTTDYLLVPKVSSENRKYVPLGFIDKEIITTDKAFTVPGARLYHFGVISSIMHMTWMAYTCGRLESRFSYSNTVVYNNFPWPSEPSEAQKKKVETATQKVLDARTEFPNATLADLYDPNTMPKQLLDAHRSLDAAVDACYRKTPFKTELERLEYLFGMYKELTKDLFTKEKKKGKSKAQS